MSPKLFFLFFLVAYFPPLVGQTPKTLQASSDKAHITFRLYHPENEKPWSHTLIKVVGKKMALGIELLTNSKGEAEVLLPIGDVYTLHLKDLPNFGNIDIGTGGFQEHYIPIPYDGVKVSKSTLADAQKQTTMLRFSLCNKEGQPLVHPEKITIEDKVHQKVYHLHSNKQGQAALQLPRNGKFVLSLEGAPNYYGFEIPSNKDIWEERIVFERKAGFPLYPSIDKGLLNFRYIDLENRPAANEKFDVINCKTGETFSCTTNKYGIAQILVPLNQTYWFSTPYNPHFEEMEVKLSEGFDIFEFEVLYQSPSASEWAKRNAEIEALSALRDSMARMVEHSKTIMPTSGSAASRDKDTDPLKFDEYIPIGNVKSFYVKKAVDEKAARYRDSLALNAKVFEQHSKPVLATLNRFRGDWNRKIIVTDVTKSMAPYMEEVLLWHALNLVKGNRSKYIFFNDGDDKITTQKKIGETGGIYFCEGKLEDLEGIISKMQEASSFRMGGGEPPENDVEALLAGIARRDSIDEIILIADAHSRVRDMELLVKVHVPVRIILCGAEEKNKFYLDRSDLNEQYLTIAHRSGGSIHTLSKDIVDLSQKSDGDVIELQGIRYLLKNHQFIRL